MQDRDLTRHEHMFAPDTARHKPCRTRRVPVMLFDARAHEPLVSARLGAGRGAGGDPRHRARSRGHAARRAMVAGASARRRTRRSRGLPRHLPRRGGRAVGAASPCAGRTARAAPRPRAACPRRVDSYLARPEFDGPLPSLWMGEGGIALVAWLLSPTQALADRLAQLVVAEPDRDTLELMWGSPGLLLIADVMLERTGDRRWASAWSAIADHLMAPMGRRRPGLLDPAALRLHRGDPRARARAGRGRRRARPPPGPPPGRPAPPGDHRGAVGHRDPRGRARELAARAPPAARQARRLHPHPVVPRRPGPRGVLRHPAAR